LFFAGCDVGAISAKLVILEGDSILAQEAMAYKMIPRQAAAEVMKRALEKAGLSFEQLDGCVACGFGRKAVPYATGDVPEIMSLSRGVRWARPGVRTVIDAGGQKIRAFNIEENGKVLDSATNEKCASGTGRFIEVMAKALDLSLDSASALPLEATDPVSITSQCGVFAESELITYVNNGRKRADIVAGLCRSVATRIASLVRSIRLEEEVVFLGGVARNTGVVDYTGKELAVSFADLGVDPQVVGALGAALVARERHHAAESRVR
jgi:predicted CoA-substrate-specific enzyme activase